MQTTSNIRRNPFVALCDHASRGNWCWKLFCTTCGHGAFHVSFSKIVRGQHPDDESFWPNGKKNHSPLKELAEYNDFHGDTNPEAQEKLAYIDVGAKLTDIQAVAKFPDWLGYIGIVLQHCQDFNARMILSDALLPQFMPLVKSRKDTQEYFKGKHSERRPLEISDLSLVESTMLGHD